MCHLRHLIFVHMGQLVYNDLGYNFSPKEHVEYDMMGTSLNHAHSFDVLGSVI